MAEQVQFIQTTPRELENAILEGIQKQLETLKSYFQPKEPTEYLSRQETADFLKIDLSTLHNYTKKGKLKAWGLGNRVFYKRHEIEAAIIPLNRLK